MEKYTRFVSEDETLMQEWDWEKNSQLDLYPNKLAYKSNKVVSWICHKGHRWDAAIYHRTSGQGCPYCSNKKVIVGYNDLVTVYPELMVEWNYSVNVGIDPYNMVPGSAKIVSWKCSTCGNVWSTSIRHRTERKSGCPKCATQRIAQSRNATILNKKGGISDSLLLQEWNYKKNGELTPQQVTSGSGRYVWWVCSKCGYEWEAKILNRAINKRGCPLCANKVVVSGKNDLATTHPQLAKEWHPTKNGELAPDKVTYGMGKKIWWRCPQGHEYQATILHRSDGTNCPVCNSGRQTSFAEQAIYYYIKKIHPDAKNRYRDIFTHGMELDIFIPSLKVAIEYDGSFWHKQDKILREQAKYKICNENGIKLIRVKEGELPKENNHTADVFIRTDKIETEYGLKNLIQLLLDKLDLRANMWTRKDFKSIHSPVDIDLSRDRFEIMKYRQELRKESLQELRPDLAIEWHPTKNGTLKPSMFRIGSSKKVWWLCPKCGNEWEATISHRASGTGCNVCYRKNNRGGSHIEAKHIYQYSLDGKFIKKWDCISSASRELSINSSNISMCAKHTRPNAGGFRWEYEYFDKLEHIIKIKKSRKGLNSKPIIQLDDDGNIIKEYRSLNDAAEQLKIDASSISKVLHGVVKKAGGYKWKFLIEETS